MTIVFVPQDPKDPKEAKIKCGGLKKSLIQFDVSVFGLLTLVSIFGSISGWKEMKLVSIINYRSFKVNKYVFSYQTIFWIARKCWKYSPW